MAAKKAKSGKSAGKGKSEKKYDGLKKYPRKVDPAKETPDAYVDKKSGKAAVKRYGGPVYELKDGSHKEQLAPMVDKGKTPYRPRSGSLGPGDSKTAYGRVDKKTGKRKKYQITRID